MNYKKVENLNCEFHPCNNKENPCHKSDKINCLFCFCPLYNIMQCGGNYTWADLGVKDCTKCTKPHEEDGYDFVMKQLKRWRF